jgi:hypothetical protein
MVQAPLGAGGGRKRVQMPGPFGGAVVASAGVFGQRREEPQAAGVGTGEVLLADIPGVGEHGAQVRAEAGLGQLLAAGVQQGVQQGAAGRVLGQHRADDDLLAGDHELAVVPGDIALLVAHHRHVGVGGVRLRRGVVAVGAWRLITGAPPAPFAGRRGRVPRLLLGALRITARRVLGGEPVPGGGQPLPPFGPAGQRPRRRLAQRVAIAASRSAASARIFPVCGNVLFAFCAALPASFVPSRLRVPKYTMPSAASSRSIWLNSPPSAVSCLARNRAMVAWSGCRPPVITR